MFKHFLFILGAASTLGAGTVLAQPVADTTGARPPADITATVVHESAPGVNDASASGATPSAVTAPGAPAGLWGAWRAALGVHGVTTSASLTGMWIGDVSGGVHTGGVAQSLAYAAADADLEKLTGWWKGGHAFANAAFIRGRELSGPFVGDALVASNLEAYGSLRLYDAWIEQSLARGGLSMRLGSMGADEEFCGTSGGSMFTNSAFGWEAGIGANVVNGGPIYFVPALGARVAVNAGDAWHLRLGAYDGDSFDSPGGDPAINAHGVRFDLSRAQGAFLIAEACHEWGGKEAERPGCAKLGAWRHTADFPDNLRDSRGASFALSGLDPAMHHGNQGVYGALEQKLWNAPRGDERGIFAWTRIAAAPADRSMYSSVMEAGLHWAGPFAGRGRDALGVGFVTANVSPDLGQHVRDANAARGGNAPVPDWERVVEAAWQFRFGEHFTITPDAQWVMHPGTTSSTPNAVVAGLRVSWQ